MSAPQKRLHARHQFKRQKRFDQVIISAQRQPGHAVIRTVFRRNDDDRQRFILLTQLGADTQAIRCVLFLYRDSYYASQNPDGAEVDADTAECIVAKNRHGETSTVPLGWDGAHTRFMDVDFKR